MTAKITLLILTLTCLVLQWMGMRSALAYRDYHALVQDVAEGRMETDDAGKIADLLKTSPGIGERLDPEVAYTRAMLRLYDMDLAAVSRGIPPLQPSKDAAILQARQTALQSLKDVLASAPHDGGLWLHLALVGIALELPDIRVCG